MATMKTLKFPGSNNVYEMVDATARAGVASLQTTVGGLVDDTAAASAAASSALTAASDLKNAFEDTLNYRFIAYSNYYYVPIENGRVVMDGGWPRTSATGSPIRVGIMQCQAGDVFTINGTRVNSSSIIWIFCDASGSVIQRANDDLPSANDLVLTAPENTAFLIAHGNVSDTKPSYKGLKSTMAFVTPEMYGAVGDGVTDDSQAWQDAVNSGFSVIAASKKYKCHDIEITQNIDIDCNNAEFICNGTKLFYAHGEILGSINDGRTYDYSEVGFSMPEGDYANYTGYAMIIGNNNFAPSRPDYRAGFPAYFNDGVMKDVYPTRATNVNIVTYIPIRVTIKNIADVIHSSFSKNNLTIHVAYGVNCIIDNINANSCNSYIGVDFEKCLHCYADHINFKNDVSSDDNNSYIIAFIDSCYCFAQNSNLYNKRWHCITTGGTYLCYRNHIINCSLLSDTQYAYADHPNGVGIVIENSKLQLAYVTAGATIKDCVILPTALSSMVTQITIEPSLINDENAAYTIDNVLFVTYNRGLSTATGINIKLTSAASTTLNCYINKVTINKCYSTIGGKIRVYLDSIQNGICKLKDILITNSSADIICCTNGQTGYYDMSDYVLTIRDYISKYREEVPIVGYATALFGTVILENCTVKYIKGNFTSLMLMNVRVEQDITVDVSGDFVGTYVKDSSGTYLNVSKDNTGSVYGQKYLNGEITVVNFA